MSKPSKADHEREYYLEDIPMAEAQTRLREMVGSKALASERVSLRDALGRITAEAVFAKLSSPHYHAAAMDGYAVTAANTLGATETAPRTLSIPDQAMPINTGDPLPAWANAVIMIEHVQLPDAAHIRISAPCMPWSHVRMMGEDMVATEMILPANHRLRPVDLGALAGCGHHDVTVWRRPKVVLIPTGSELVPVDASPQAGQVIEYNSLVLSAQIEQLGGEAITLDIVPDDPTQLLAAIQSAATHHPDLLLILSGSSAGSRDFTAQLIQQHGTLAVHGVAVRPGHPVIIGKILEMPVIGVPGYPVSAALTGEIFIEPLLAAWLGQPAPLDSRPRVDAILTRKLNSPLGDDEFERVTLAQVGDKLLATPIGRGAGVISSLVRADGLAHIPRFSEGADKGAAIPVILYTHPDHLKNTALAMGSHDPLLDLLAQFVSEADPALRLVSANVGSLGGIIALRRGEAHLAGSHLLDPQSGTYNISDIQKYLNGVPLELITFVEREQGLIVPKGNPKGIQGWDDLRRVSIMNRQRGAGTRVLLDYHLAQNDIAPDAVEGYAREAYTHLAVAAAVASGSADCGLGVRRAADALDLDFVSLAWERYDFILPRAYTDHHAVALVRGLLQDDRLRENINAQAGYNADQMGVIQYEQ